MSESKRPQLPRGESGTSGTTDNADITVTDVILPRDHFVRMERQLAAAERLYSATRDYLNAWEDTEELADNLHKALSDYANAKEQK